MKISLIVAVGENGVIGNNGDLPWHLPADLRWFKAKTQGHFVLMGRRTWESFPGQLPNRTKVVISRGTPELADGVLLANSLEAALDLARVAGEQEVFIAGGATLYVQAFSQIDRIYLTRVHASFEGDTWFPAIDLADWQVLQREDFEADEKNAYPYSFFIYEKPGASTIQDDR